MELAHPIQITGELDIDTACSSVTFISVTSNIRVIHATNVDQVVAIRVTADTPGKIPLGSDLAAIWSTAG